jgi:glycerophosphoryl diester phosphodiesterase
VTPRRPHAFLDHPAPIPFVHRGGPTGLPENTIVAFDRAYQMGFRYFETDVHATTDGVLVAFHDRSLRRLTGERVPIASLSSDEVAMVRVDGEPVPLLEELLSTFPDTRINIDPKDDGAIRPLVHTLRTRGALDRVCLASFSDVRLRWLRAAFGSRACTAAGPREIARARWSSGRGRRLDLPGVDVVQLPPGPTRWPLLDQRLLEAAHEAGIPVHVWTINDPQTMDRLLGLGVDGIMSDDARALRQVFRERGIWQPDLS